ncbi:hypothetical protein [Spirosoma sp. KNUC1025]|uniref:hypothetical protein n=1 Tax=Spirosoma sp. KNUC1025 TaxID=2894082 RepID=UPI003865C77E|nr:hypothetical protein LN737_13560 [Spirosoma sp. KNUC1025]
MNNVFDRCISYVIPVCLLGCLTATYGYSQSRDSLLSVYNNQTIHSFGRVYVKGGNRLSFRSLRHEFTPGPAQDLYQQSRKKLLLSNALAVAATAALVGSAILRKNENAAGVALLVVGIGINLGNFRVRKRSTELVDQALWLHNRKVLFNTPE